MNDHQTNSIASILIAIFIFIMANTVGAAFQAFAEVCYQALITKGLMLDMPPPNISNMILEFSLIDLFLSPFACLQIIRHTVDTCLLFFSNETFKLFQVFCQLASLINVGLSLLSKKYNLNLIISLSLGIAYAQIIWLFFDYLLSLIIHYLDSIFFNLPF